MKSLDELVAKQGAENRKYEAKAPAPTKEKVEAEAAFLRNWSRGKDIRRASADSTFWSKGKYMTKITFKMAQALADAGFASLSGDPKEAGARLVMNKPAKK